jgi:FkbM family methyltransferase
MIVSYAQNFEDVMLLRALKHVEKGFYIDAGANDPAIDSVTKAFYEKGWNGINIEPLSVHFSDLQRERPRDINLHSAVGPSIGEIEIWECNVRGWATADKAVIEKHSATGHTGRYLKTPMSTLTAICEQHAPQEIHFLKIDVEGFERSVLEGMDFQRFRPWIVVMEAISPNSTEKVHAQWESLLMVSGYFFVYADGINRFYLAREHEDLVAAFEYPPNFLDSFVPASQIEAETRANQAETRAIHADACTAQAETRATQAEARAAHAETCAAQAKARAVDAEARLADTETCITQAEARAAHAEACITQAEARAAHAEACITQTEARAAHAETCAAQLEIRVAMLINSTSWRITAPMRVLMDTLRGLSSSALTSRSKMLLRHAALYVIARPKLKRAVVAALARMPAVKSSLSRIITVTPQVAVTQVPEDRIHLSPRVRHIYSDLKTAIGNNKKDNG